MSSFIPTDHITLSLEQSLDQCIKCNICTSACPFAHVTELFPGPKYVGPQAQRFRKQDQPSPDIWVDYCSGCRICNMVCPTGVKIAELNSRARAEIVASRGLPFRNWIVARSELLGKLGTPVAALANWTLQNRPIRWAIERIIAIDRRAPLPRFAGTTFRGWMRKHRRGDVAGAPYAAPSVRMPAAKRQVVYFHGCSTNYYEPGVGKAAIQVLEHNGFEVIVPPQNCCGLPLISNGDFDAARDYHRRNVRKLYRYVAAGIPIVGTSTSCTLTIKEEAPEILSIHDPVTEAVGRNTYDIFEFLRLLHERGELRTDFEPIESTLPYHPPCQLRAHGVGRPVLDVLGLVPGLRLDESQADCCGIAGTYGIKREKYQISMDVGAPLFEFVERSESDLALCDSETCRWQITHATGVATEHPIELLRRAYGLPVAA